jgi:hypothetical protein
MAFIAGTLIIFIILALLGAAAQTWGVDSRDYRADPYIARLAIR